MFTPTMRKIWNRRERSSKSGTRKRELADSYCAWLFDILFELENRLDISDYNANDRRVFGFVAERLLDVWLETNHIRYKNIPYIFLEKENWFTKGAAFIKRKLEGGKAA